MPPELPYWPIISNQYLDSQCKYFGPIFNLLSLRGTLYIMRENYSISTMQVYDTIFMCYIILPYINYAYLECHKFGS